MNERKDSRVSNGEQRHRLGKPIDRRSPLLIKQQQNGRDKRSSMADTDPPNKVYDRKRPACRLVGSPDPDTFCEKPDRRERDTEVERIFEVANLPLVRFKNKDVSEGDIIQALTNANKLAN